MFRQEVWPQKTNRLLIYMEGCNSSCFQGDGHFSLLRDTSRIHIQASPGGIAPNRLLYLMKIVISCGEYSPLDSDCFGDSRKDMQTNALHQHRGLLKPKRPHRSKNHLG